MPSSHAQFVSFFSAFLTLFLLLRHTPHPPGHPYASRTHDPLHFYQRVILSVASFFCAAGVAQSRIYLNYHNPRQVYVGFAAGVLCAVGWFIITEWARKAGWVDWILNLKVARLMRFRDLVVHEDLVDAGYERFELRRRDKMANHLTNGHRGSTTRKQKR